MHCINHNMKAAVIKSEAKRERRRFIWDFIFKLMWRETDLSGSGNNWLLEAEGKGFARKNWLKDQAFCVNGYAEFEKISG